MFYAFGDHCLFFCSSYFGHSVVCPSIYDSDYHFGIFKLFLNRGENIGEDIVKQNIEFLHHNLYIYIPVSNYRQTIGIRTYVGRLWFFLNYKYSSKHHSSKSFCTSELGILFWKQMTENNKLDVICQQLKNTSVSYLHLPTPSPLSFSRQFCIQLSFMGFL